MLADANQSEDDFWFLQTARDLPLKKAISLLPKEPERSEIVVLAPRQKKECGYKKSHVAKIARASFFDAIPDPIAYSVIHPQQSRLLTNTELRCAFGFPKDWKYVGNEVRGRALSCLRSVRMLLNHFFTSGVLATTSRLPVLPVTISATDWMPSEVCIGRISRHLSSLASPTRMPEFARIKM